MLLYFLRHGDASQDLNVLDSERPLTDLGTHQASVVASFLKRSETSIEAVFCSPLRRAQLTASIVQKALGSKLATVSEYLVPAADQRQLFEQLNSENAQSFLLVGHEPQLSKTVSLLTTGNEETRLEFKKSSLACVEVTKPIRRGKGILKWLVTVEQMERLT